MANESQKIGLALTGEQIVERSRNGQSNDLLLEALQATFKASELNQSILSADSASEEIESIRSLRQDALRRGGTAITPEKMSQLDIAERSLVNEQQKHIDAQAVSSRSLNKELSEALALLPEGERAAFLAGFLRHHDLIKVDAPGGGYTYERNPDEHQAQPGYYIPAAAFNIER